MKRFLILTLVVTLLFMCFGISYADVINSEIHTEDHTIEYYLDMLDEEVKDLFLLEISDMEQNGVLITEDVLMLLFNQYSSGNPQDAPEIQQIYMLDSSDTPDESTIIRRSEEEKQWMEARNEELREFENEAAMGKISVDVSNELSLDLEDTPSMSMQSSSSESTVSRTSRSPMIDSGITHTVYLRADGTVWTWGEYTSDRSVYVPLDIYTVPTKIGGLESIVAISAGAAHNLALRSDGKVFSWGSNFHGQLGDGTTVSRQEPVLVGIDNVVAISAGSTHSMALKADGSVYAWGENLMVDILGTGAAPNYVTAPRQVLASSGVEPLRNIKVIEAGNMNSFAITNSGNVFGWGMDSDGIITSSGGYVSRPTNMYLSNAESISAYSHLVVLKVDGSVVSKGWGSYVVNNAGNDNAAVLAASSQTILLKTDGSIAVYGRSVPEANDVAGISAGISHAVILKTDGSIWSSGSNSYYQLGTGTGRGYKDRATPANMPANIKEVSMTRHGVALTETGRIVSWGDDLYGALFDGCNHIAVPKDMGVENIKAVAAGGHHNLYLKEAGTVLGFGYNAEGQAGNGGTEANAPVSNVIKQDLSVFTGIKAISAGAQHSIALDESGTVWSWGHNGKNQLGKIVPINGAQPYAAPVVGINKEIKAISAGLDSYHNLALDVEGSIWVWGDNSKGQLGTNDGEPKHSTPQKLISLENIIEISAGQYHSLALDSNGNVYAWGLNVDGQLGNGTNENCQSPVLVMQNAKHISAGYRHSVALKEDGTVWSWGNNTYNQLGNGTNISSNIPARTIGENGSLDNVQKIYTADQYSIALKSDGTSVVWGNTDLSGDGLPEGWRKVINPTPAIVKADVCEGSSIALKSDGTVWASGKNKKLAGSRERNGFLGTGSTSSEYLLYPEQVKGVDGVGYLTDIVDISIEQRVIMALKNDGTVYVWGLNETEQLCNDVNYSIYPLEVEGLPSIKQISAGSTHCLALADDGQVYGWGSNIYGELGNGGTDFESSPVIASGLTDVIAVSAGNLHSLALKCDGTVWGWGYNVSYAAGHPTKNISVLTPYQTQISDAIAIDAGYSFNTILKSDGTAYSWGAGYRGALGTGTTADTYTPQIIPLNNIVKISLGWYTGTAITSDGKAWAWGYNSNGQLGNVNYTGVEYVTSPVEVTSETQTGQLSDVVMIKGHSECLLAVKADGTLRAWGYNQYGAFGMGSTGRSSYPIRAFTSMVMDDYGDTFDVAEQIYVNQQVVGEINIPTDVDMFKFTADHTSKHYIESTSGVNILLYDSGNTSVPLQHSNDVYDLIAGKLYYIKVTGDTTGNYIFRLKAANGPNGIPVAMKLGQNTEGVIGPSAVNCIYYYQPKYNGLYTVEITNGFIVNVTDIAGNTVDLSQTPLIYPNTYYFTVSRTLGETGNRFNIKLDIVNAKTNLKTNQINISSGIFFINAMNSMLYKESGGTTTLYTERFPIYSICGTGDKVYYSAGTAIYRFYNGIEKKLTPSDVKAFYMVNDNENVYFSNWQDAGKIYRVKAEGGIVYKMCNDTGHNLYLEGDSVRYYNSKGNLCEIPKTAHNLETGNEL